MTGVDSCVSIPRRRPYFKTTRNLFFTVAFNRSRAKEISMIREDITRAFLLKLCSFRDGIDYFVRELGRKPTVH